MDTHASIRGCKGAVKGTEVIKSSAVFKNGVPHFAATGCRVHPFEMGYGFPSGKYSEYEFAVASRKP